MPSKTFIKITNKDIYDRIEKMDNDNSHQHGEIIEHQLTTNGKVKKNTWVATTAISLALLCLGFLINHLVSGV